MPLESSANESSQRTSLSWIARMRFSRDESDWRTLAEQYRPLLSGWIARAGVPPGEHDDILQEVMVVVVRRIADFEHRHPGCFRGWLRAILTNLLRAWFRNHPVSAPRVPLDSIEEQGSELSRLMDREHDLFVTNRVLEIARRDFTEPTWQAFEHQVLFNLTSEETATLLDISPNAALKAKSRVLSRLREELHSLLTDQ